MPLYSGRERDTQTQRERERERGVKERYNKR